MEISLGHSQIGSYYLYITQLPDNFYDLLVLLRHSRGYLVYVDPIKVLNLFLNERNPLAKITKDEVLSPEKLEFRAEFDSFMHCRSSNQPVIKLSERHAKELLEKLKLFSFRSVSREFLLKS